MIPTKLDGPPNSNITTTPTTLNRVSPHSPPLTAPEQNGEAEAILNNPLPLTSPRALFDSAELTERMRLCREPIVLDADDQEAIMAVWKLERDGFFFRWSLESFLKFFASYFASKPHLGTIELTSGALQTVGSRFCEKTLRKVVGETAIAREVLNLAPPRCFEFWVTLPRTYNHAEIQRFQNLAVYFFAAQALPALPNYGAAACEFAAFMEPVPSKEAWLISRLSDLTASFQNVSRFVWKNDTTIEICCGRQTFLRITFAFSRPPRACYRRDDFRLQVFSDLG